MQKLRMLVLTDHTNHSAENSLYPLVQAFRRHPRCQQIDVASRGIAMNDRFFNKHQSKAVYVTQAFENFAFSPTGEFLKKNLRRETLRSYDVVWLRMPPPLSKEFLHFLSSSFPNLFIINAPSGIYETGSKEFLMQFRELCPPMKVCRSVEDIIDFKRSFPIVLKPFREYGGKGIVRIDGDRVWQGKQELSFEAFANSLNTGDIEYLGVKFLQNVAKGDKRIVVIAGNILGASLRLPPKDSWICNVAMGGQSHFAEADEQEVKIIKELNPVLEKMGIVMYGIDTLVGDDGKRILSEINTTSIGGLPQIAALSGKPTLEEAASLIWNYIIKKNLEKDVVRN